MEAEIVRGKGERGTIELVAFPSGTLAVYITAGGLHLHFAGHLDLDTLERWSRWLGIGQPENWRKDGHNNA